MKEYHTIPNETYKARTDSLQVEAFQKDGQMPKIVFLSSQGFRLAYAGIPWQSSIRKDQPVLNQILRTAKEDFSFCDKHTGLDRLTAELTNSHEQPYLWVGFDTGHLHDPLDFNAVYQIFGKETGKKLDERESDGSSLRFPTNPLREAPACMNELSMIERAIEARQAEETKLLHLLSQEEYPVIRGRCIESATAGKAGTVRYELDAKESVLDILKSRSDYVKYTNDADSVSFDFVMTAHHDGNVDLQCYVDRTYDSDIPLSQREATELKYFMEKGQESFEQLFCQADKKAMIQIMGDLPKGEIIVAEPDFVGVSIEFPVDLTAELLYREQIVPDLLSEKGGESYVTNGNMQLLQEVLSNAFFLSADVFVDKDGICDMKICLTDAEHSDSYDEFSPYLYQGEREGLLESIKNSGVDIERLMQKEKDLQENRLKNARERIDE